MSVSGPKTDRYNILTGYLFNMNCVMYLLHYSLKF